MAKRDVASRADRAEAELRLVNAKLRTEKAKYQLAVIKQHKKKLSTYDGAKRDRRDKDWRPGIKSADAAIIPDLPMLMARARAAQRDTPIAESIIRSFGRNVIGAGITPVAVARFKDGRERKKFNKAADEAFSLWADDPLCCDVEGVKTFWDFQKMIVEEMVVVGEFMIIITHTDNEKDVPPLRLQGVEAEQLDLSMVQCKETGNQVRGGVEVDEFGRPVAYHIHRKTTNDLMLLSGLNKSERVPAERVIHHFVQRRVGQTRGVTWLAPVLRKMRDLSEYDMSELFAARMQSCIGLGIERPTGAGGGQIGFGSGGDNLDNDGNREITFEPGMTFLGEPGEKIIPLAPNRPGGQYDPFKKSQNRDIASGTGLSYGQATRDFSDGNFSSQRQTLLEDRREWKPIQKFIEARICKRVWEEFLKLAVLSEVIEAPRFFQDRRAMVACEWQPDGWDWVDPAKQAAAAKVMLEQRLTTRKRILNEAGENVRETFQQISDEGELADELGINLPGSDGESKVDPVEPRPQGVSPEGRENEPEKKDDKTPSKPNEPEIPAIGNFLNEEAAACHS